MILAYILPTIICIVSIFLILKRMKLISDESYHDMFFASPKKEEKDD